MKNKEITDKDRLDFLEREVRRLDYNNEGKHRLKTTLEPVFDFKSILFYGASFREAIDNAILAMREASKNENNR
jgi:hypothetical protein